MFKLVFAALLVGTILGAGLSPRIDARAACLWGVEAVDGDTIKCHGKSLRLVGINAPEIRMAQCAAERELGRKAKSRLEVLAADRDRIPTQRVSGGAYGRGAANFTVGGVPIGEILVREGLAVRSVERRDTIMHWCTATIDI